MKRAVYIVVMLIVWYIAGMYRLFPLMVLAVALTMAFFAMWILSHILAGRLDVTFESNMAETTREARCTAAVTAESKCIFPVERFRIRLRCSGYGKEEIESAVLYGNAESQGKTRLTFSLTAPHCGIMELDMVGLSVFDPLSLFYTDREMKEKMRILVLPVRRKLRIEGVGGSAGEISGGGSVSGRERSMDRGGIRQLREYRAGDECRDIHWKQSARTDTLLLKEYEPEPEHPVRLGLDLQSGRDTGQPLSDAFYEVLCALLDGLAEQGCRVLVFWKEKSGVPRQMQMPDEADSRRIITELYLTEMREEGEQEKKTEEAPDYGEADLVFDAGLCIRSGDAVLLKFSLDSYVQEIESSVLQLTGRD